MLKITSKNNTGKIMLNLTYINGKIMLKITSFFLEYRKIMLNPTEFYTVLQRYLIYKDTYLQRVK